MDHAATMRRLYELISTGDIDGFGELVADDFVEHEESPGLEPTTRVRLRGVDAPELKAACPGELQLAEAAGAALRGLLGEGGVTIHNIGPDKYHGRVVADVATRRTDNVSAALLAAGHARGYRGGHRNSWC